MVTTKEMIDEMAQLSHYSGNNNVSDIASELGYPPLWIFNALDTGEKQGIWKFDRKKDTIELSEDLAVEQLSVSEATTRTTEEIEQFVTRANKLRQNDVLDEQLSEWARMPIGIVKLAIHRSPILATYDYARKVDGEDMDFTFVTLKENVDKKFGKKQFKEGKK